MDEFCGLFIPILVLISILLSFIIASYGVMEASYNYPGGVAITQFPFIVKQNEKNVSSITELYYNYDGDYDYNYNPHMDDNYDYNNYREYHSYSHYDENYKHNQRRNSNKQHDHYYTDSISHHRSYRIKRNQNEYRKDYRNYQYRSPSRQSNRNRPTLKPTNHTTNSYGNFNYAPNPNPSPTNVVNIDIASINNDNDRVYNSNEHYFDDGQQNLRDGQFIIDNEDEERHKLLTYFDEINCVHIGNKAAMTGVTRYMTPSYYDEFRFNKLENLSKEDYAKQFDPCNLYKEVYDKICKLQEQEQDDSSTKWDDDIFDEEYFNQHDDFLNDENETIQQQQYSIDDDVNGCNTIIQRQLTKRGFDYIISEFSNVPGYQLIPHGIIYAKSTGSSIFTFIKRLFSFSHNNDDTFLTPTLYVLKRQ